MNRMQQIAVQLGKLYKSERGVQIELSTAQKSAEARRVVIAPAEGWPGKNETERKLAQARAEAADSVLNVMLIEIASLERRSTEAQGEISALEAERRAEEWTARVNLVDTLRAIYLPQSGADDSAYDDVAEAETDKAVMSLADAQGEPADAMSGIPF